MPYKDLEMRRACGRRQALRYYHANREACLQRNADYCALNRVTLNAAQRVRYAKDSSRQRAAARTFRHQHPAKASAWGVNSRYGMAALFVMDLFYRFQDGRDYISNEPLTDGFHLDHDHATDLVRGLLNEKTNRLLGCNAGDSLVGCRQRLATLKNKDGKLGTFCKLAIAGLWRTPAVRMGLEYRLTGNLASLPESRQFRERIEIANMLMLGRFVDSLAPANLMDAAKVLEPPAQAPGQ